jgi:hypothetical protein
MLESRWDMGPGYTWEDLTTPIDGNFGSMGGPFTAPPTIDSYYYLLMDCALYAILAWYFDHVIQHNRGVSYSPWFFFEPKFWCKRRMMFRKRKLTNLAESSFLNESNEIHVNTV